MKRIVAPDEMTLYLSDESRRSGRAEVIYFPETEQDICQLLQAHKNMPVTIQGGRTGVTAGAVPDGGLVINLSGMDRILRLPGDAPGHGQVSEHELIPEHGQTSEHEGPTALVQPGVLLCHLQGKLNERGLFFPPDPTETTASIGGMIACNSSGARTYRYGATRNHIRALRMVLSDGDTLSIRRGQYPAKAGFFSLTTDGGRTISGRLPAIQMPQVSKHTAGYYIHPDMDMLDLLIGSEGTLGIVTLAELDLRPQPAQIWGTIVFFENEACALRFVHLLRTGTLTAGAPIAEELTAGELTAGAPLSVEAIEFFGVDTLDMLRGAQSAGRILTDMPRIPSGCAIYAEFAAENRTLLRSLSRQLGQLILESGGDPDCSWFAFRGPDMKRLKDFRHAAPVCVNERISEIRARHPGITKLGTDMSVPDDALDEVFRMYRKGLSRQGFLQEDVSREGTSGEDILREEVQTSLFGHIGNNHLHCNIIPRNDEEYLRGKQLYTQWAEEIVRMGGSVSAEHGIGKLKTWLLQKLYTPEQLAGMMELKRLFDPDLRLNPGNIFGQKQMYINKRI